MMNKILYGSIVLLFGINAAQLYFSLRRPEIHPPRPREIIIDRLNFNAEQVEQYDKLIQEHQDGMRSIEEQLISLKSALYKKILLEKEPVEQSNFDGIATLYVQLEKTHVEHFKKIHELCQPVQELAFQNLVGELGSMFRLLPPKPRRH